jgi:hypothetical protein
MEVIGMFKQLPIHHEEENENPFMVMMKMIFCPS